MKYFLFLFFLAAGWLVQAQDACRFDVNKKDAFTGERTSITRAERMAVQVDGNVHFQAVYENEDYFLRVKLSINKPFLMPKGNQVWIMLNDDNVLKVNSMSEGDGSRPVAGTRSYEATFDLDLSDDQWQILKSNPVKRMRFIFSEGFYDLKVKPEKSKLLQQLMTCVENA
jgi:hypothetical protein